MFLVMIGPTVQFYFSDLTRTFKFISDLGTFGIKNLQTYEPSDLRGGIGFMLYLVRLRSTGTDHYGESVMAQAC